MEVDYQQLYNLKIEECKAKHCPRDILKKKEKEMNERVEKLNSKLDGIIEIVLKQQGGEISKEDVLTISKNVQDIKEVTHTNFQKQLDEVVKKKDDEIKQMRQQLVDEKSKALVDKKNTYDLLTKFKKQYGEQTQIIHGYKSDLKRILEQAKHAPVQVIKVPEDSANLSILTEQLSIAQNKVEVLFKENERLKQQINKKPIDIIPYPEDTSSETTNIQEHMKVLQNKVNLLQTENDELRKQKLDLLSNAKEYEIKLANFQTHKHDKDLSVPSLQKELDALKLRLSEKEELFKKLETNYKEALSKKQEKISSLRKKRTVLAESEEVLKSEIRTLKDKVVSLQSSLEKAEKESERRRIRNEELKDRLRSVESGIQMPMS